MLWKQQMPSFIQQLYIYWTCGLRMISLYQNKEGLKQLYQFIIDNIINKQHDKLLDHDDHVPAQEDQLFIKKIMYLNNKKNFILIK